MEQFRRVMTARGELHSRRRRQRTLWMYSHIDTRLHEAFYAHRAVQRAQGRLERLVEEGNVAPGLAADVLIQVFLGGLGTGRDLAGTGKDLAGTGRDLAGTGKDPAGTGKDLEGSESGKDLMGSGGTVREDRWEASDEHLDLLRTVLSEVEK